MTTAAARVPAAITAEDLLAARRELLERPGCGEDCPCQLVRALDGCWPVFSSGAVGVLVEPPMFEHLTAALAATQGRDVRFFQWSYLTV